MAESEKTGNLDSFLDTFDEESIEFSGVHYNVGLRKEYDIGQNRSLYPKPLLSYVYCYRILNKKEYYGGPWFLFDLHFGIGRSYRDIADFFEKATPQEIDEIADEVKKLELEIIDVADYSDA